MNEEQKVKEYVQKIIKAKCEFDEENALDYWQRLIDIFARNAKTQGLIELRGQYYELKII